MNREEAQKINPYSPEYQIAQDKARAMVRQMQPAEKFRRIAEVNTRSKWSQRIWSDGGLIRAITVDILAGIIVPDDEIPPTERNTEHAQ